MDQSLDLKDEKLLAAARSVVSEVGRHLDLDASVELWNGERVPLGPHVAGPLSIRIASPGVITSILRRPTLDRIIQHYVQGQLDLVGGTLLDLGEQFTDRSSRRLSRPADLRMSSVLCPKRWPPSAHRYGSCCLLIRR